MTHTHLPPKGYHASIVLPNVQALMTGVSRITQDSDGTVTAWYTDGSTESCLWPDIDLQKELNIFSTIGTIQEKVRTS